MDDWRGHDVLVAGAGGVIGRELVEALTRRGARVHSWRTVDGDLRSESVARDMMSRAPFRVVFALAATQGGVADNLSRPLAFLRDNLQITLNTITAADEADVPVLVYAASTAIYPERADQPYFEEQIGDGAFEASHGPYALAKLCGVRLCELTSLKPHRRYVPAVLTNVYGRGSSFNPVRSTVAASLVRRAIEAQETGADVLTVWGGGRATRDLMHATDAAEALVMLAEKAAPGMPVNVCTGVEASMREIAETAGRVAEFSGRIAFDASKPEGALRRVARNDRLRSLGFTPRMTLEEGFRDLAAAFRSRRAAGDLG